MRDVQLVLYVLLYWFQLGRGRYGVGNNGSSRIDNGQNGHKGVNGKNGKNGIVNGKNGDSGVNGKNGDNGVVNAKNSDNGIVNGTVKSEIMQLDVVGYKAAR